MKNGFILKASSIRNRKTDEKNRPRNWDNGRAKAGVLRLLPIEEVFFHFRFFIFEKISRLQESSFTI